MKKFHLTRVLAVVMMLAMVLGALAGCGSKNDDEDEKKSDAELIVGKWEGKLEFEKVFEAMGQAEGGAEAQMFMALLEDIDTSDLAIKVKAEFKADGTYTAEMDGKSMESAVKTLMTRLTSDEKAVKKLLRAVIAEGAGMDPSQITDDMLEQVREQAGASSWEEVGEMLAQQLEGKDFQTDDNTKEGKYMFQDGKLYMSDDVDTDPDPDEDDGKDYKVTKNSLTLEIEKDGAELDVTFKRAG